MKSIVLCERTLVQESENFSSLKEERINEESNEKAEEKNFFNGIPDSKSESDVDNLKKDGVQNGDRSSNTSFKEGVYESDGNKRQPSMECDSRASTNYLTSETNTLGAVARNSLNSDTGETDSSISESSSSENKILENLEAKNSSDSVENPNVEDSMNLSVEIEDDAVKVGKSGDNPHRTEDNMPNKNFETVAFDEKELKNMESKENLQSMDDIILDMDENKENEKEEKPNGLENYAGNDLNKHSNECEIQVGEVQSISGAEKDSIWSENDLKKCEQDLKDKSEEKLMYECQDITTANEESINTVGDEKEDEGHEAAGDETVTSEAEESVEEGMHIEVEESEQAEELKVGEKESDLRDLDNFSTVKNVTESEEGDKGNHVGAGSAVCRKRPISESKGNPSAKKKRLLEDREELDQVQSEEEYMEDSSRCESLASLDTTGASSEGHILSEAKMPTTKRSSTDDKNRKKLKASIENEESEVKKNPTAQAMFSVLEKFRGTLKTLTRSDLEELIVQKLCEVITERSNVGELRRKAQALEQDQERWKTKAQSLTKQMREMEMVMKKYMTEVQKQIKEGDSHVVTPLKVTRSVGLQVSFYSSANKGPKPILPQPTPSSLPQNINTRNAKGPSPKLPSQFSPATQSMRNKPTPSFQKSSQSLQKSPVSQHRRPIVPKPDYCSTPTNRPVVQSNVNSPRGVQNQAPRPNFKPVVGVSTQQQQPQTQQQQQQQQQSQQQQQNGSKVIDLTEDDDRQTGNVVVKTSGPIRVVNHLSQPPASQNNRFAYLLPTTSSTTATSSGQSRQVLIATPTMPQPNRQIMCSMPPLLFKGGNVVQSGSQSQMLNQSNKVILPKPLRHPAPLPKRPLNQNTRPSLKLLPPRPALKISKVQTGIVLSWNMALSQEHAPIASYQLYAYQESDTPPSTSLWKKVGDVKALPLPMACTLTQFMSGHKYHFAVRAVDLHSRIGPFSFPGTIVLV